MAAYMRKTGILPVCTNNEARAYFADKGLTYADVTEGDILTLVMLLNKHIKKANADCETSIPPPARLCLAKAWLFSFWTSISTRPCR